METATRSDRRRRPLRLLWLIDSLAAGGAESLLAQQACWLRADEARLHVCCLKTLAGNPFEVGLRDAGVAVTNIGSRGLRDRAAFRRLAGLVDTVRPDVIHAHLNDAATWGALLARRTGVPLVITLHVFPERAPWWSRRGLRERLMVWLARHHATHIVAVSSAVADAWSSRYAVERGGIDVVLNGVDTQRLAAVGGGRSADHGLRGELGVASETPLVLVPSVLRPGKGHEVLLRAIRGILERAPDARFLFAGEGPLGATLRRRAEELEVAHACLWLGFRTDMARLYRIADLAVLPSDQPDALPTVLIEAMASGTPFVASAVGGVGELTGDSRAGTLVPPGDPEALGAAVGGLLADAERRRRMGERGRRHAAAELSVRAWWERMRPLYARAIGSVRRGGPDVDEGAGATAPGPKVVVAELAGDGGMIHWAFQFCRALADRGFEVVLATDRRYELEDLPHSFRVERIFDTWEAKPGGERASTGGLVRWGRKLRRMVRAARYMRQWLALRRFVRRERPDVLQLGDLRFAVDLLGVRLLRRHAPLLVDICHNVRPFALGGRSAGGFRRSRVEAEIYRRMYRLFDVVLVHYEGNRRAFLSVYDVDAARVGVLPLGNFEIFSELQRSATGGAREAEALARELDLLSADRVVLMFGTLSRYKGIDDLLEAFATVHRRFPAARLVIVGFPMHDFDVEARRRAARELGIAAAVRFVPRYVPSQEVASWMELAEIAVFPHRAVYQSASLQVARTFGLPVVASDVGANGEQVRDGESGLLVPPADPARLATALMRLLEAPSLAARLGGEARRDAHESGSWERVADAWAAALKPRPGRQDGPTVQATDPNAHGAGTETGPGEQRDAVTGGDLMSAGRSR